MDNNEYQETLEGVPQGGPISVLLSNIYLHYALDLWVEKVVKPALSGEVYYVRYVDDFVLCFQYKHDAIRFQEVLVKRLARFSLSLEPSKTRLIRFAPHYLSRVLEIMGSDFKHFIFLVLRSIALRIAMVILK